MNSGPESEVTLVPIGRPFNEGTSPLLENAALFSPPIPRDRELNWRVEFDWPQFSDRFRNLGRDYYEAHSRQAQFDHGSW